MRSTSQLGIAALAVLGGAGVGSAAAKPAVNYWSNEEVAAAFAKGAVLYGPNDRNYMVHASRRDKPGMAEVHALDTDIIYVLSGSATLVTGGTVVDGGTTEANEIRGAAIRDGETRTLAKG